MTDPKLIDSVSPTQVLLAVFKNPSLLNTLKNPSAPNHEKLMKALQSFFSSHFMHVDLEMIFFAASEGLTSEERIRTYTTWVQEIFPPLGRDPQEVALDAACMKQAREMRLAREEYTGGLKAAKSICQLSRQVHENIRAFEEKRSENASTKHAAFSELLAKVQVRIEKIQEETAVTLHNERHELQSLLEKESQFTVEQSPELPEIELKLKKTMTESDAAKQELTVITGKISQLREEKLKLETAEHQVTQGITNTESHLNTLLGEQRISLEKVRRVNSIFTDFKFPQIHQLPSSSSSNNSKANFACCQLLKFRLNKLTEILEKIKSYGAVTDETDEMLVEIVLTHYRQAEREQLEISQLIARFSAFLPGESMSELKILFEEITHFAEPFKVRHAELRIIQDDSLDSPVSGDAKPIEAQPTEAAKIQRKDSFEDLLGI